MLAHQAIPKSTRITWESDTVFPTSPGIGQMAFVNQILYLYTSIGGVEMWFPLTNAKDSYVHTQAVSATTWTITHNLDSTDFGYHVYDSNGNVMDVPIDNASITSNSFAIELTESMAGKVVVFVNTELLAPSMKASVAYFDTLQSNTGDTINFSAHLVPTDDITWDIGTSGNRVRDIYVGPGSVHIGDEVILNATGLIVSPPAAPTDLSETPLSQASQYTAIPFTYDPGGGDVTINPTYQLKTVGGVVYEMVLDLATNKIRFDADGVAADATVVVKGMEIGSGGLTLTSGNVGAVDGNFSGNVVVTGNFTVNGTTTTVNTTELDISDNIYRLNADHVGIPSQNAGFEVERGDELDAAMLWVEAAGNFQCGISGSLQPIVLDNDSRLIDSRVCNNTFDNIGTARTNLEVYSTAELDTSLGLKADQTSLDTHTGDSDIHFPVNDSLSTNAVIWTAAKIVDMLSGYSSGAHTHAVEDNTNVTITNVGNLEVMAYNLSGGQWNNMTPAEAGLATASDLSSHEGDAANPHSVTKAQVGLGSVADALQLVAANNLSDVTNITNARSNIGAASTSDLTTHTTNAALHFVIDDGNSAANEAWSSSKLTTEFGLKLDASEKGADNGVCELVGGLVPNSRLDASVLGQVEYQSGWNANTNTPTIPAAASGNKGHYYVVTTGGSTDVDGVTDWVAGDMLISNGTTWDKMDNTANVTSVAGKTGPVTLVASDVGLGNVVNALQLQAANNLSDLVNDATARTNLSVYSQAEVDSHTGNSAVHFILNDTGTANNEGWSAQKINSEVGAKADAADLTSHTSDSGNPHGVTKAQVSLGSVTDDAQLAIANNLSDLNDAPTARTNMGLDTVGLTESNDTTMSSGGQITANKAIMQVHSAGGEVTLSGTAQIVAGVGGQEVKVLGTNDTNYVKLTNGAGLILQGNILLKYGVMITLMYVANLSAWVEVSRNQPIVAG